MTKQSTSNRKTGVALVIAAFLFGVLGTALVMTLLLRTRPATSEVTHSEKATEPGGESREGAKDKEAAAKPGEKTGEEPGIIKLSPEAVKSAGIRAEPVAYSSVGERMSVPGTVEVSPNRGAKVTPPVPGKVVRLLANLGDIVRAGQPLAVLDSFEVAEVHSKVRDAEASVRQAQAAFQTSRVEVDQARAGVAQAQAEVDQARTKQRSAETALQRQRELAAAGTFSQPSLQAAQSDVSEAQSELLRAQTDLQAHTVALQRAERLFKEELISRTELEQAQLEHRQDQTAVEKAQGRVALTKQTLEREQKVSRGDLLNRQAIQTAEAEARAAQGDVLKALQAVSRAQQDVRRAQKGEQAARTAVQGSEANLSGARANLYALEGNAHADGGGGLIYLTAPIGGTVTDRQVTLGQAIERASTLFVIENLNTVQVDASVPEKDVARIRTGQPVEVTVAAYPGQRFTGMVQSVAGRVDEKTRALTVRSLVENRSGRLKPEMFARVSLATGTRASALSVPRSALDEDGADRFVYVQGNGGFERRKVEIGRASGPVVEIVSGVKPGERVVVGGVFVLKSESKKGELKGDAD